jgi:MFS family permease
MSSLSKDDNKEELGRGGLWAALTADEASFVKRMRLIDILGTMMFKVMWASWNQSYLDLCGNDTGMMAVHYGWCRVGMGVLMAITNPIYSAVSDCIGRKHLMAWGRLGWMWFFFMHKFRDQSLTHRLLHEWICWGVVQTGVWPTFAASHSDMFGTRPELYSRIQAADNMWINWFAMLGGPATTLITLTMGLHAAQPVAGALALSSMLLVFTLPETLPPAKRKKLPTNAAEWGGLLARANPFANLLLLLNKGPGLRRLSVSTSLWFMCQEVWATQGAFRVGNLGWTPTRQSYFTSLSDGVGGFGQVLYLNRLLGRLGNRRTFELGALISVLSYAVQGLCAYTGPLGSLRVNVQYCLGVLLLQTLPVLMPFASRSMIVKQGITMYEGEDGGIGRGQLSAAYSGLGQITSIVSPMLWGWLYRFFLRRGFPTGYFFVPSAFMLAAWGALRGADPATLFIEDAPAAPTPGP